MTPIRVTAYMAEPVVCYGDGRHLDSLLAWCVYRRESRRGREFGDPQHMDFPPDLDLPLARWQVPLSGECRARLLDDAKIWGWRASDAVWGEYIESSYSLRKMPDADDFVRNTDSATYKHATGALKPKDKTYPVRFAPEIEWYAVGDVDAVRTLLREVTHVGKLSGLGMGRVRRWEVEAAGEDWSVCKNGILMRRMPASVVEADQRPTRGTVRPPYWHPSREVAKTYPTGTEVEHVE